MVLNVHRNHKVYQGQGEGGKRGYGGGGRERLYTYCYTVTTRMSPALRWAMMRPILMFHNCEGQSHKTVSTDHNFWRERRAKADSNRSPSAYQPNALPLGHTGSPVIRWRWWAVYPPPPPPPPAILKLVFIFRKCCFMSTETTGLLGTGAQDGHLDFHTAPELCTLFSISSLFL